MKHRPHEIKGVLYTCTSERDNPYDLDTQPKEHAAWREAYWAVRFECGFRPDNQVDGIALKDEVAAMPEQREFALVWRPFFRQFRLRVHDVIRINGRLGRVIRVTDCAAVVLVNRPTRRFVTRFDKPVQFEQPPVLVRIGSNSETEVLNRRNGRKRKPPERRTQ